MNKIIKEMFKGKKIDIKNLLLYTPFDERFRIGVPSEFLNYMSEEKFIKEFYIEDELVEKNKVLLDEYNEINNRPEKTEDDIEDLITINQKRIYIDNEILKKENFEHALKESISKKPFLVRGVSGAGKTTYLHHLMYTIDTQDIWVNYDLFESSKSFTFFGKNWTNDKFNFTQFKLLSSFLKFINDLLVKNDDDEFSYKNKLSYMLNNYERLFFSNGNHTFDDIFYLISKYVNGDIIYQNKTIGENNENLLDRLFGKFDEICNFDKKTPIEEIDITNKLNTLLQLTIFLLICIHAKSSEKSIIMPKIYISFDNLEHFINNNKIYDEDIYEISTMIFDFMDSQKDILPIDFYKYFKVILLIRDTTDKMLNPDHWHDEDFPNNIVDVSDWYNTFQIYDKKIKYFQDNNVLEEYDNIEMIKKALSYIFSDNSQKGLNTFINAMYNNNKRRITRYLITALTMYEPRTKDYIAFWEKSMCSTDEEMTKIYKHAARSIIKRTLFDLIESSQYFTNLKAIKNIENTSNLGLARKLLTVLYRLSLQNVQEDESYIGMYTVLSSLFDSPTNKLSSDEIKGKIEHLVGILYHLNDHSIVQTNWCQLIDIKLNRKAFNAQSQTYMSNFLFEEYIAKRNDDKYGIKITSAGKTFLSQCQEFEYFTCRYKATRVPLFCSPDLNYALNTIKEIKKQTFKCIEYVVASDKAFVSVGNNYNFNAMYTDERIGIIRPYLYISRVSKREQQHVLRIIDSHISYIDMYRTYILSVEDESFDEKSKLKFSNEVLSVLTEYVNLLKEICSISSKCGQTECYYIGGYRRSNGELFYNDKVSYDGKNYYQDYLHQLSQAKSNPLDVTIRIVKK